MKSIIIASIVLIFFTTNMTQAAPQRFGESLCKNPDYFCIKIRASENWKSLFPHPEARDIVKRINRMNVSLRAGMIIAVPKYLDRLTIYDVSPFPRYIEPTGEKSIYVSKRNLAWGAYDADGELLWWGPVSPGKSDCRSSEGCITPQGSFRVIRKQDIECISTAFPRRSNGDHGGAAMPYCMHFFRGYALHGSDVVPGYSDSHGCVRLFIEDARWLNEEFIDTAEEGSQGTRVIIGS